MTTLMLSDGQTVLATIPIVGDISLTPESEWMELIETFLAERRATMRQEALFAWENGKYAYRSNGKEHAHATHGND